MTTTPTRPDDFFDAAFQGLAGRVRSLKAQRSQRIALTTLLEMDHHRLNDLGLSVHEVRGALEGRLHRG